nr:hypothetical protein SHINE37_43231 [Rhizobiaceae bacterium]
MILNLMSQFMLPEIDFGWELLNLSTLWLTLCYDWEIGLSKSMLILPSIAYQRGTQPKEREHEQDPHHRHRNRLRNRRRRPGIGRWPAWRPRHPEQQQDGQRGDRPECRRRRNPQRQR